MNEDLVQMLSAAFQSRQQKRTDQEHALRLVEQRKKEVSKCKESVALREARKEAKQITEAASKANTMFEESLVEILTGETGLPMFDAAPGRTRQPALLNGKPASVEALADHLSEHMAKIDSEADKAAEPLWFEDKDKDEEKPIKSKTAPDSGPTLKLVTATSEDIDDALTHALGRSGKSKLWLPLVTDGATNDAIGEMVHRIWPRSRLFVTPEASSTRYGYTLHADALWIGDVRDPLRPPVLSSGRLIDRIRTILEIPTPTEVQRRRAKVEEKPAVKERPTFMTVPQSGWSSGSLYMAAVELGNSSLVVVSALVICNQCHALRYASSGACANCTSIESKPYEQFARELDDRNQQPVRRRSAALPSRRKENPPRRTGQPSPE